MFHLVFPQALATSHASAPSSRARSHHTAVVIYANGPSRVWARVAIDALGSLPRSIESANDLAHVDGVAEFRELADGQPVPHDLIDPRRAAHAARRAASITKTPVLAEGHVVGQKRALAHYDADLARGPAGVAAAAKSVAPGQKARASRAPVSPSPKSPVRAAIARRDTAKLRPAQLPVSNAVKKVVPQPIIHSTSVIRPVAAVSHGIKTSPTRALTAAAKSLAPIRHDGRPPMGAPQSHVIAPKATRPAMGSSLDPRTAAIAPKHNVETVVMGAPKPAVSFKPIKPKQVTAPASAATPGMRLPG